MKIWVIRLAELLFLAMAILGGGQLLGPVFVTPRIIAALQAATGRSVTIDGSVVTDVFPAAMIELHDVNIANRSGGSDRPMLKLGRVQADLSWTALLQGRLVVNRLEIDSADLLLETGLDHTGNWRVDEVRDGGGKVHEARARAVAVGLIDLKDIHIAFRNGTSGHTVALAIPAMSLVGGDAAPQLRMQGTLQIGDGQAHVSALTGSIAALRGADISWPFRLGLGAPGASVLIDGALNYGAAGIDIQADLSGQFAHLGGVAAMLPGLPLPALHHVIATGHASFDPARLSLRVGGVTIGADELRGDGDLAWRGTDPSRLSGSLAFSSLDIDALAHAATATAPPQMSPPPRPELPGGSSPAAAAAPALFSRTPWPDWLFDGIDLDLNLTARRVLRAGNTIGPVSAHLVRADSRVGLAPMSIGLQGNDFSGSILASGNPRRPDIAISLTGQGLPATSLLQMLDLPPVLTGTADVYLRLNGQGESAHAVAATASGAFGFATVGGDVETGIATGPLGPLLPQLGLTARQAAGRGPLRCFALAGDVRDGLARIRTLTLDSAVLFVEGGGSVALGPETLDLQLKPTLRLPPVTGIAIPARMTGPILSPSVGWDGPAPQGRAVFSAVIGTATQLIAPDACDKGLVAARYGRSGAAPPPPANQLERLPGTLKDVVAPEIGKLLNRLP